MRKALLMAALTPATLIRKAEAAGDYSQRLQLMEDFRLLPFGAVWNMLCEQAGVPAGTEWYDEVRKYEAEVTSKR
jgi:L-rhamnose isomerase